jgi:hypothetical protein
MGESCFLACSLSGGEFAGSWKRGGGTGNGNDNRRGNSNGNSGSSACGEGWQLKTSNNNGKIRGFFASLRMTMFFFGGGRSLAGVGFWRRYFAAEAVVGFGRLGDTKQETDFSDRCASSA